MKFWKSLFLLIPLLFIYACGGVQVTKFSPLHQTPNYKIEAGKLTQELGVRVAILKPQGEIRTTKIQSVPSVGVISLLLRPKTEPEEEFKLKFRDEFNNALLKSIEAILLQKGYNVVAAYESWDALTYEDKKRIDMLIIPEFNLKESGVINPISEEVKAIGGFAVGKGKAGYSGDVQLKGDLIVTILEPMTREKMWIKQLTFEGPSQKIEVEVEYGDQTQASQAWSLASAKLYEARSNSFTIATEAIYQKYIEIGKAYLPSGEEAINLAKQARELKTIKRY